MYIPESISRIIGSRRYETDGIGKSQATVRSYDDMVLKIGAFEREYEVLMWLVGKRMPVPNVLAWEQADGMGYLLMSRMGGEMLCADSFLGSPNILIKRMAEALNILWECDVSDCPYDASLATELKALELRVESGLCSMADADPITYGKGGFDTPASLYKWLYANRPEETFVLSHGDFCLPNIFATDEMVCGFIDIGAFGVADRYRDITLGYRSLYNNFEGCFSRPGLARINYDDLFSELGMTPDRERLQYYLLLDELYR